MNRLNYFNPYQSKTGYHEDQLTRAYLVILKHSSHAFSLFVKYCQSKHTTAGKEKPIVINALLKQGWAIETQKENPKIKTDCLLSILITDLQVKTSRTSVQSSERNARYDGTITFGSKLTMVIENKPRSGNVWFGQLNPSRQNLAVETKVYSSPIVLEWKEIIKQLNHLKELPKVSSGEKILINDFFEFVDESFPHLNPFDSFHQCKGDAELINRRIKNLLKSIALHKNKVDTHKSGSSYILTPYRKAERICLGLNQNDEEYSIDLGFYFGDTQRQAFEFYSSNPNISHLKKSEWNCHPNFHVAFMRSNLFRFQSGSSERYLRFWKDNVKEIRQQKRKNVRKYIKRLADEGVVKMTKEAKKQLHDKFFKTTMQNLNICPGFVVAYSFNSSEAEALDKSGKLKFVLAEKIREGLKVVGLDAKRILKNL